MIINVCIFVSQFLAKKSPISPGSSLTFADSPSETSRKPVSQAYVLSISHSYTHMHSVLSSCIIFRCGSINIWTLQVLPKGKTAFDQRKHIQVPERKYYRCFNSYINAERHKCWLLSRPWLSSALSAPLSLEVLQARKSGVDCHSFPQGILRPRDWIQVFCIAVRFFTIYATGGSPLRSRMFYLESGETDLGEVTCLNPKLWILSPWPRGFQSLAAQESHLSCIRNFRLSGWTSGN